MKKMVWRDAHGAVINIGDWDDCAVLRPPEGSRGIATPLEDGRVAISWVDADGEPVELVEVPTNLPPAGTTSAEEDVVEGWDGGLYVAGDPRAVRA